MRKETKMAKKPPLGSGERFKAMVAKVHSSALAGWIGRKKYGAKKMGQLSAKGKADNIDKMLKSGKPAK